MHTTYNGWTETHSHVRARTNRRNWQHACLSTSNQQVDEQEVDEFLRLVHFADTDPEHIAYGLDTNEQMNSFHPETVQQETETVTS